MFEQGDLFSDHEVFNFPEGKIDLWRNAFSDKNFDNSYDKLLAEIQWRQDKINFMGKEVLVPRLNAWYGDPGKSYTYSGISFEAIPWTDTLLQIKEKVEELTGAKYNSVLCNFYRNESDSVARHSDDEKELGTDPTIASVSFGETRTFILRHKFRRDFKPMKFSLNHNSLFVMSGKLQQFYDHEVPKSTNKCQGRINLTFRKVI